MDALSVNSTKAAAPCDYSELQECLAKNKGDRSKCLKEWEAFQKACAEKKKQMNPSSETCEACQAP
ncbi:hypothetical protein K493DRAFT_321353 [Basidiobolus meristosporus CBS 931.73]|uniref:CHCH domain-containing protein n=1 Tax=Basidiobolus meristosporus CBS 931.73 TaxID=1314790 RepID=A0A1Y1WVJ1_9FUNG|nr:hypothetical protein K493DRAFT_321353 [Basidiobolus meristosporus CBS 931.73]|eukprot:ORX77581.1 hypothetical protein K493DRAFT_321353 [Basidiobolus meristosporus CBS 931.73]